MAGAGLSLDGIGTMLAGLAGALKTERRFVALEWDSVSSSLLYQCFCFILNMMPSWYMSGRPDIASKHNKTFLRRKFR